jgi:predicted RND superfamily exporter protein
MEKFADFAIKRRFPLLVAILIITLFFLYQLINPLGFFTDAPILKLRIDTDFAELLPQRHPYIKIHNKIKETFGGANQVIIMVQVRKGDIFNQETLGKVKEISERLEQFPAVDRYKIRSIAMSKMKHFKFTSGTMDISPLMFPEIPHNQEEMEELKKKIYSEGRYYGPYVSWDSKKTLILVDFFEEELAEIGYDEVFNAFIELQNEMEDENHIINIAGEPVHLGYIRALNRKVLVVLGITTLAIMILLYFYYRSKRGMFIPIMSAAASGIWGLGFMAMAGFNLDPLILVLPFLISLMTARHSMQLINRYLEEVETGADVKAASHTLISSMFAPGVTGIITDALGIGLVAIASIPILQNISIACAFWSVATVILALLFTPLVLSYIKPSKRLMAQIEDIKDKRDKPQMLDRMLAWLGAMVTGSGKWVIVAANVVLVVVGFQYASTLHVGDFFPGSSILWPWHRYNKDAMRITTNMPLLNPLYVVLEGEKGGFISEADTIREMERFRRFIMKHPRVMFVSSISDKLPSFLMASHEANPNWSHMPNEDKVLSFLYRHMVYSGEPGTWDRYVEPRDMMTNIIIYCRDKMPKTTESVIASIKDYITNHSKIEGGKYLLAGGAVGVEAGVREEIAASQTLNLTLALSGVFIFCAINFGSILAGLLLTIPLAISNIITFALMGAYSIGVTVNTYPVSSIGIGLGVDYGIYFVGRLREERKKSGDLNTAIINSMKTNGKAIVIIATTLTVGLMLWIFSALKFQAYMGVLLAILLLLNMLGALLLLPSMIAILKPKFLDRGK